MALHCPLGLRWQVRCRPAGRHERNVRPGLAARRCTPILLWL